MVEEFLWAAVTWGIKDMSEPAAEHSQTVVEHESEAVLPPQAGGIVDKSGN